MRPRKSSKRDSRGLVSGLSRANAYALIGILAIGFLLRLLALVGTPVIQPLRADAAQYYAAAHNLRVHSVYSTEIRGLVTADVPAPNAARSPGYPLLLTLLIGPQPTQDSVDHILLTQVLLGTLVIGLVFIVARRLLDEQWALVAALLTAFSPHLVNIGLYVLTETLLSVMLLAFVWSAARIADGASRWRPLLAGALLGYTALVHPTFEYFILPWLLLLAWSSEGSRRRRMLLSAALGFALVFSPWVIRNHLVLDGAGDAAIVNTIHHGLYPDFRYQGRDETFGFPYRFDPASQRISQGLTSVLAEAQRRFTEQPVRHLRWFLVGKPIALWSWDSVQGMGDTFIYEVEDTPYLHHPGFIASHGLMRLLHLPLLWLGMLGAIMVWLPYAKRRLSRMQLLGLRTMSLLLIYATAVHLVGAPFPRYATPLRPLLYIMALAPLFLLTVRRSVVTSTLPAVAGNQSDASSSPARVASADSLSADTSKA